MALFRYIGGAGLCFTFCAKHKKWQGIIVLETDARCRNTLALLVVMVDFAVLGCDDIWGCVTHAVDVMYTRLADRRYV